MSLNEGLIPVPILSQAKPELEDGFYVFRDGVPCPHGHLCLYFSRKHFHCSQPRCYFASDKQDSLLKHSKNFHDTVDIKENFVFFDKSVDCRLATCTSNRVNRHYHCTRPGCNFSFEQYTLMSQHDQSHYQVADFNANSTAAMKMRRMSEMGISGASSTHSEDDQHEPRSPLSNDDAAAKAKIKARGTFYPMSSIQPKSSLVIKTSLSCTLQLSNFNCRVGKNKGRGVREGGGASGVPAVLLRRRAPRARSTQSLLQRRRQASAVRTDTWMWKTVL